MSNYKLVTAKGLVEFVLSQPTEREFCFATDYDGKAGIDNIWDGDKSSLGNWRGIKKTRLFDCDVILVGQFGTFAHAIIDARYMDVEEIVGDMELFFKNSVDTLQNNMVCLNTSGELM